MTLVVNEILERHSGREYWLVAAADRRIWSPKENHPTEPRQKLFRIPYLNGAVSYYGIADVYLNGKTFPLSNWLADFINREHDCGGLEPFVAHLREQLHRLVPKKWLKSAPSGIHLCGHDRQNLPQFWHFCNHDLASSGYGYENFRENYGDPTFWIIEGSPTHYVGPYGALYWARNGQYRSHAAAWYPLDFMMDKLAESPEFLEPDQNAETYGFYVKFKFEVISHLYSYFAKLEAVGPPIDVLVFRSTKDKITTFEIRGKKPRS